VLEGYECDLNFTLLEY